MVPGATPHPPFGVMEREGTLPAPRITVNLQGPGALSSRGGGRK